MHYFDFYQLPISFLLDESDLKKRFLSNSKKFHPDFHTLASDEKQAEILELSTLNTEAYKVLSDFDKRMKYILDIKNVLADEGKNKLPPDFLMEMMDLNETLSDLQEAGDENNIQEAKEILKNLESELENSIKNTLESYNDATATESDLEQIKIFFLKRKYFLRIQKTFPTFASQ